MDEAFARSVCERKTRFTSQTRALKVLGNMRRGGKAVDDLRPYRCDVCEGWHLGHTRAWRRKK